jgi:membrane dipeptidase
LIAVFDGHNDAITKAAPDALAGGRDGGHLDLPRMVRGGMRGGIFAIFTPSSGSATEPVRGADGVFEVPPAAGISRELAAADATAAAGRLLELDRAGALRVVRRARELDDAIAGIGPPAAVMHLEGAEAIDPRLEALSTWHAAGLRSLGPVWSRSNVFGHGVPFRFPSSPDTGPGLTNAGRALVAACGALGIAVDLSHLNERGFWDAARIEHGPLIASHSGVHAISPMSRNLTDRQLDEIGQNGGLVGVFFACPMLRADFEDDPDTPLSLIVEHVRHVAERIGVEHVALGSDFDGVRIPAELGDVAGLPRLLGALAADGFTRAEVQAIANGNWRRVLRLAWREQQG